MFTTFIYKTHQKVVYNNIHIIYINEPNTKQYYSYENVVLFNIIVYITYYLSITIYHIMYLIYYLFKKNITTFILHTNNNILIFHL